MYRPEVGTQPIEHRFLGHYLPLLCTRYHPIAHHIFKKSKRFYVTVTLNASGRNTVWNCNRQQSSWWMYLYLGCSRECFYLPIYFFQVYRPISISVMASFNFMRFSIIPGSVRYLFKYLLIVCFTLCKYASTYQGRTDISKQNILLLITLKS